MLDEFTVSLMVYLNFSREEEWFAWPHFITYSTD